VPITDNNFFTTSSNADYILSQMLQIMNEQERRTTANEWRMQQQFVDFNRLVNSVALIAESLDTLSADLLHKAYEKATEDLKRLLERQNDNDRV